MSVILVLIGASLFVAIGFLIAFIWAVKNGQYDDKYTPSVRMLFDDEVNNNNGSDEKKSNDPNKSSSKIETKMSNEDKEKNKSIIKPIKVS